MGQFPGVNIPVYVIGQSAYYKFKDILSANDIDPIKIELDVEVTLKFRKIKCFRGQAVLN